VSTEPEPDDDDRPLPHVPGVRHRRIPANGITFHIAEAGTGGDTVVLLHGFPQHWYEWRHLMPVLATRHRVIAIDLRGHGWSDAPATGYDKEEMATDVLAVLDALRLSRVKLVGHDWGGWIGFLACLRAPERFQRFLVLNAPHPWPRRSSGLPHAWRMSYQLVLMAPGLGYLAHRTGWFLRLLFRLGVHDAATWDRATLATFLRQWAQPARARAGVALYRTFTLRELIPITRGRYAGRRLSVPTRVVFGVRDIAISHRLLDGHQPYADSFDIHLVPDCGHFIADERPDLVAQHALEFFG
jgi:pimeloyl-ACP methyl ester carboxylesterase